GGDRVPGLQQLALRTISKQESKTQRRCLDSVPECRPRHCGAPPRGWRAWDARRNAAVKRRGDTRPSRKRDLLAALRGGGKTSLSFNLSLLQLFSSASLRFREVPP